MLDKCEVKIVDKCKVKIVFLVISFIVFFISWKGGSEFYGGLKIVYILMYKVRWLYMNVLS
jgi:hypothetical protein